MEPRVLVVAKNRGLSDLLEDALMGDAHVYWVPDPDETEGTGVVAVIVDEPYGDPELRQLSVHPTLSSTPVILLGHTHRTGIHCVDARGRDAVDLMLHELDPYLTGASGTDQLIQRQPA